MNIRIFLLLFLAFFGVNAQDYSNDQTVRDFSNANTEFSLNLFKKLTKPGENLVVSGYSVSTVLAMVLEGAQANTATEIRNALKYSDLNIENLSDATKKVIASLKGTGNYELSTVNSIWINNSFHVRENYKQKLLDIYQSEAKSLRIESSKTDINQWVDEKTSHAIPEFLDNNLDPSTLMYLINAVYFKGPWKFNFSSHTFEDTFLNNDTPSPADIPSPTTRMMRVKKEFDYTESSELNAKVLDLKYKGEDMSLTVILPEQGTTLANLESILTAEKLQKVINDLRPIDVSVSLPKFRIENTLKLKDCLQELGISDLFSTNANLTGISADQIAASSATQKTIFEVDEKGTTAAAATGIVIAPASINLRQKHFRANKPFLFFLRHKPTNTVLFFGRYTKAAPFKIET